MLARLDDLPGVEESRIDWTGHTFLLTLAGDADAERIAGPASEILGSGARRVDAAAEAGHVAAFRRGDPWMRSGETLRLSAEEARVLGDRFAAKAAQDAALDAETTRKLTELVQDETRRLLESLHADGGGVSDRFVAGWAPAVGRIHTRSRAFLTQEQADRVASVLRARFEE